MSDPMDFLSAYTMGPPSERELRAQRRVEPPNYGPRGSWSDLANSIATRATVSPLDPYAAESIRAPAPAAAASMPAPRAANAGPAAALPPIEPIATAGNIPSMIRYAMPSAEREAPRQEQPALPAVSRAMLLKMVEAQNSRRPADPRQQAAGTLYDLAGKKMQAAQAGIYNGKKLSETQAQALMKDAVNSLLAVSNPAALAPMSIYNQPQ